MSPRVAHRDNFEYRPRPSLPAVAPLLLPGTWLLVIGLLNLFYAISVIADSHIFITTASWLVGDTRPYGWLMLLVALVQLAAVPAVLSGRWWGFWVGLISVAAHVIVAIMFAQDYLGIAIALLLLDAAVFASLLAAAARPRPAATEYWS
jgi:hypothetical protein